MDTDAKPFLVSISGREFGPFSLNGIREQIRLGTLTVQDFAWRDGMDKWVQISEILITERRMPVEVVSACSRTTEFDAGGADKAIAALAKRWGIALDYEAKSSFPDAISYQQELGLYKLWLPPVRSVYKASGKIDRRALISIPLGALKGSFQGFGAGFAGAAVAALLTFGILWILSNFGKEVVSEEPMLVFVLIIYGVAIPVFLPSYAVGLVFAHTMTVAVIKGRCRNANFPIAVGILVGILLVPSFWFSLHKVLELSTADILGDASMLQAYCYAGFVVGTAVLIYCVVNGIQDTIRGNKFCEKCGDYLIPFHVRGVSLPGSRLLVKTIRHNDMRDVAEQLSLTRGEFSTFTVEHCKKCGQGLCELAVNWMPTYLKSGDTQSAACSWIAASVELSSCDVQVFNDEQSTSAHRTMDSSEDIQGAIAAPTLTVNGRQYSLTAERLSIGRDPDNDVVIQSESVSSHHAEIISSDGQHVVRDLGSTNGTKVDGEIISEAVLKSGNVIVLGSAEMSFCRPMSDANRVRDGL